MTKTMLLLGLFGVSAGITGCDGDGEAWTGLPEDGLGPGGSGGLGDGDGDDDDDDERPDCAVMTETECDVSTECTMVWGYAYVPHMAGFCVPDVPEFLACVRADEVCDPLEAACSNDHPGVVYRTTDCASGFEVCAAPGVETFGCES